MKKGLAMLMAAAMSVSMLVGCGSSNAADDKKETTAATEAGETAAEGETAGYTTVKEGVLMVASEIGYPPMEYYDEDGITPIGFDMELARAIAEDMGLEVELVDTAWDGIFAGVDTAKYDVVMAAVSWTPEREEDYTLSKTYVANAPVIVVRNDSDIADIADLEGKSVAVQMETTADYLIQEHISNGLNTDLRQYDQVLNAFDELKAGRVDSVCTDQVVANYYLGDAASDYKTVWQSDTKEPFCMVFKKGNDALKDAVEASYNNLKANGKLAEIAIKYFGEDVTADLD